MINPLVNAIKTDRISTNQPLVSIIVPVYNSEEFIAETIESVIKQTYQNWELIIVDDKSTDNSIRIAKCYAKKDTRIKVFELEVNSGRPAIARNYGLKQSCGEYIAFLDSDDVWLPSKLDKQICHFQDQGVLAIGAKALWIKGSLASRKYWRRSEGYLDYRHRDFLFSNHAICSSVVVRKDIALSLNGFDEHEDFLYIEDWEFWLRIAQKGKFRILQDPLLFYRIREDKKLQAAEASKRQFCVIEKNLSLRDIEESDLREARANINLSIAINLIRIENHESRKYFIKALNCTRNLRTKMKAVGGYLLSILPVRLFKLLRIMLYRFKTLTYCDKRDIIECGCIR